MTDYTANLRIALDLIDGEELPHVWIGSGLGAPNNIDIDVKEDADIGRWAAVLGVAPELNLNNKRSLHGRIHGLALTVTSRQEYQTSADPEVAPAEDAATVTT